MSSRAIAAVIIFVIIVITASSMFNTKMKHDIEISRLTEQTNQFKTYYENISSNTEVYLNNTRQMNELVLNEIATALKVFAERQKEINRSVVELKDEIRSLRDELSLIKDREVRE